jgi:hypothetical protein
MSKSPIQDAIAFSGKSLWRLSGLSAEPVGSFRVFQSFEYRPSTADQTNSKAIQAINVSILSRPRPEISLREGPVLEKGFMTQARKRKRAAPRDKNVLNFLPLLQPTALGTLFLDREKVYQAIFWRRVRFEAAIP